MKRWNLLIILGVLFLSLMHSHSYAQAPKEISPVRPDVKTKPIGLPPLPDLIIVGKLQFDRQPFIAFSALTREESIIVPIRFRIQNIGNGDAGRFQISIFQQISPLEAEREAIVEGDRYIDGLRPSTRFGEGIGSYNLLWNVIFPKSLAGKTVKIKAMIDSRNEVIESSEINNGTPWLEVTLPAISKSPGK